MKEIQGQSFLQNHPCYNKAASANWGRLHLPVAPNCNIQCNYCNRKYDCANENRPGVTQHVYTPQEAAAFVRKVFDALRYLCSRYCRSWGILCVMQTRHLKPSAS